MYEEIFSIRLAKLRIKKGISAREMSLSIGQNAGYINNIETGKALPSMSGFFYICEYLNISPKEFFDTDLEQPEEQRTGVGTGTPDETDPKPLDVSICRVDKKGKLSSLP